MAKDYSRVFKLDSGPSELVETPIVRKKFRVTIDVEATLASGTQGIMLPPSPEGVCHTEALTERLLAQPELVDQLLRCRAVEVAKQAGKALEAEYLPSLSRMPERTSPKNWRTGAARTTSMATTQP
jgi:hypothetical protein